MSPRKPSSPSSKSPSERPGDLSVYLHFPFCLSKCPYCDFDSVPLSTAGGETAARRYLDAMAIEMDMRAASPEFLGAQLATVYCGGGTPTTLPPEWLANLLARLRLRFPWAADAEVTVEANPGAVSQAGVRTLLDAGVTRISLGVQSFSDGVLRTLGRAHTAAQARAAVEAIRAAGCQNLNLDLIYGVPGQTEAEWGASLEEAVACGPEHVSVYALSVEKGTPLAADIEAGRVAPPDDDLAAAMYLRAADSLARAGYEHYEISNFARPGRQCRHNRRYWLSAEYLGLGCSAHSHRRGIRWNNWGGPEVYTQWVERGVLPVERAEALGPRRRLGEMLMLGLRLAEGVSEQELARACGLDVREVFGREIARLCQAGMLLADAGRLRIPQDRWLLSDEVLSQFAA